MRTTVTTFAAAILALALVGCGGSGSDTTSATRIIGAWEQTHMRVGNQSVACPGSVTVGDTEYSCVRTAVTFRANGTITTVDPGEQPQNGTYSVMGNTLNATVNGETLTGSLAFSGNNSMTVSIVDDGVLVHSTFSRMLQ